MNRWPVSGRVESWGMRKPEMGGTRKASWTEGQLEES